LQNKKFVTHLNQQQASLRYSGALVADVHRSLIEGGIYLYPSTPEHLMVSFDYCMNVRHLHLSLSRLAAQQ
jgi:fructose-1,6-bisphosphatase